MSKSIRCLLDVLNLPPSAFTLPDGDNSRPVLIERRSLLIQFAKFANPDGSSVRPVAATIMRELEVPERTLYRRIHELEALSLLLKEGRAWERGPRIRKLNMAKIREVAQLPLAEPELPKSPTQTANEPSQTATHEWQNRPPLEDRHKRPNPSTAPFSEKTLTGGGWEEEFFLASKVWERLDAMPQRVRDRLMAESEKRGFPKVKCAVDFFLRESFDTAKAPWLLFLSKAESLFAKTEAWSKEDPSGFRRKYVLTGEEVTLRASRRVDSGSRGLAHPCFFARATTHSAAPSLPVLQTWVPRTSIPCSFVTAGTLALRHYERRSWWDEVNAYGQSKAARQGLREQDVDRLVHELRASNRAGKK